MLFLGNHIDFIMMDVSSGTIIDWFLFSRLSVKCSTFSEHYESDVEFCISSINVDTW